MFFTLKSLLHLEIFFGVFRKVGDFFFPQKNCLMQYIKKPSPVVQNIPFIMYWIPTCVGVCFWAVLFH